MFSELAIRFNPARTGITASGNSLAGPAILVNERNNIECELVRVQIFPCLNFINPERAILAELVTCYSDAGDL